MMHIKYTLAGYFNPSGSSYVICDTKTKASGFAPELQMWNVHQDEEHFSQVKVTRAFSRGPALLIYFKSLFHRRNIFPSVLNMFACFRCSCDSTSK